MKAVSVSIKKNKTYLGPQSLLSIAFLPFSFFLSEQFDIELMNPFESCHARAWTFTLCSIHPEGFSGKVFNPDRLFLVDACTIMGQSEQHRMIGRKTT